MAVETLPMLFLLLSYAGACTFPHCTAAWIRQEAGVLMAVR